MKKLLATSTLFIFFILFGGVFTGISRLIPSGLPRALFTIGFGALFVVAFVWLLISRVRILLGEPDRLWLQLALIAVNLVLLLLAFAAVYQRVGIIDNTGSQAMVTHDWLSSIYYSVVTFTTLGYGDFYPQSYGRAMAAMEAFTGYVILGILVSTSVSVIKPAEE